MPLTQSRNLFPEYEYLTPALCKVAPHNKRIDCAPTKIYTETEQGADRLR